MSRFTLKIGSFLEKIPNFCGNYDVYMDIKYDSMFMELTVTSANQRSYSLIFTVRTINVR